MSIGYFIQCLWIQECNGLAPTMGSLTLLPNQWQDVVHFSFLIRQDHTTFFLRFISLDQIFDSIYHTVSNQGCPIPRHAHPQIVTVHPPSVSSSIGHLEIPQTTDPTYSCCLLVPWDDDFTCTPETRAMYSATECTQSLHSSCWLVP